MVAVTVTAPARAALTSFRMFVTGASQALGATAGVTLEFRAAPAESDVAKLTSYVPEGYRLITSRSPGSRLGSAAGRFFARDTNAVVPAIGTLDVANAADFATEATLCTGTPTHDATWVLKLTLEGTATTLTLPAFVDAAIAPATPFASATIVICLPPSDVPPGTPGRAPLGAKALGVELTTNALVNPREHGEYRWRSIVIGYGAATGRPDANTAVEVQSVVELPTQITLRVKAGKSATRGVASLAYTGTLRANDQGLSDAAVEVLKGPTPRSLKKLRVQTTDDNGVFRGTLAQKQSTRRLPVYVAARTAFAERDLGASACAATFVPPASPFPIPCTSATIGAFSVGTRVVTAIVPAAAKTKPKKRRR